MKKIIVFFMLAVFALSCFSGCGKQEGTSGPKEKKIKIVTTVFPVYDWTRQIAGENTEHLSITMLLDKGIDMHSYQPTPSDILTLSDADVFIYIGGESDEWVKDALKDANNKNMIAVNLMEALGNRAKREELVEGMEPAHEHEHEHKEEHKAEYDEHIWLSVKNAKILCQAIASALEKADVNHADSYKKNLAAYLSKLDALDDEYKKVLDPSNQKVMIFGDRFPFRYMTDDYGFKYYAAFAGCSAETEASFETIAFLSKKLYELKPPAILVLEGRTHKIAEAIVKNSSVPQTKILSLDSMQSTTLEEAKKSTYISIMKRNLEILSAALK